MKNKNFKKKYIKITGIVTGVGFRWWLKTKADERSVYGWAKNTRKNEVEAVFFGNEKDINNIIKLCQSGPSLSEVENIEIKDYQDKYVEKSFKIY